MTDTLAILKDQRIVPVIRSSSSKAAVTIVRALVAAGMRAIELTTTIPDVFSTVSDCRRLFPDLVIGLGTLRSRDQALLAVDVGASLLITYKAAEDVARVGQDNNVPYILGAATPTEVDRCLELGSRIVKWFPASIYGHGILRELHGPMPEAQFFPTGGITLVSMTDWLTSGAVAVGIGGALLQGGVDDPEALASRARDALRSVQKLPRS